MNENEIIKEGKEIFDSEISALEIVKNHLGQSFKSIFREILNTKGKVIITGVGKPGHIACKIAATFSSLGIPSFYLHPAEAQHGDLGMIQPTDLVIAISFSGESTEVTRILKNIRLIGARLVGITGNGDSTLSRNSDVVEIFPKFEEAGYLKLAPTSSTTVTLVYFDALAIAISKYKGFDKNDFGLFHPAGALGKKLLLKVEDLMVFGQENATLPIDASLKDAISEMCGKPVGILNVLEGNRFVGIVTDGDIRRSIDSGKDIGKTRLYDIVNTHPVYIEKGTLAVDALSDMIEKRVQSAPVLSSGELVGTIQIKDILKEGIML